jgi:hypothetical protein
MVDPQPVIYIVSACGVLFAVAMLLWQRYRLRKPATPPTVTQAAPAAVPAPVVPQARPDDDVSPFCLYCEAPAVRAPSRLLGAAGPLAELRVRFGLAPAYSPRVDDRLRPSLCETHGRAWDARIRLAQLTREARLAQADVEAADRIAVYEAESLDAEMVAALTDAQRKAYERRKRGIGTNGGSG